uniref:Interferon/interleukin receptor domain-containing protein n=1 Tax=Hucho hucho TaxID=62062 RepID=A0A4W5LEL5_9TELE
MFLLFDQGLKPNVVDSSNNLVTLPELEAWTWYCVMVQSRYDYYNKTSGYTAPQCMQTEGDTLFWQKFLYFLVSLVVCFLLVLLSYTFFRFYRVIKHTVYPTIQLPAYIQEVGYTWANEHTHPIKCYLSHAPNTTSVDLTAKC